MSNLHIAVIHFGDRPEIFATLERFLRSYHNSKQTIPLVVLTDEKTQFPADFPYDVRRMSWSPEDGRAIIRVGEPGTQFDVKGAILWAALDKLDRFLCVDGDTVLVRDLAPQLAKLPTVDVVMAPDAVDGLHNAGVMWFGASDHTATRNLYLTTFLEARINPPGRVDLLEQDVWNMLRLLHGETLPMRLNWQSHFWGGSESACIIHKHGKHKDAPDAILPAPTLPNPRRLCIGTPHMGMVHDAHRDSLDALREALPPETVVLVPRVRSSCLVKSRDICLSMALQFGAESTLFWDSDIVANVETALRILSHNEDIVGALYSLKAHPGRWILDELPGERVREDGLVRVRDMGTGFKRIKTSVLRRMILEYPQLEYVVDDPGHGEIVRWNFNWTGVKDRRFLTEDYGFDALAEGLGIPIYADTKAIVGHWGHVCYPLAAIPLPGIPYEAPKPPAPMPPKFYNNVGVMDPDRPGAQELRDLIEPPGNTVLD
jgi:hypothetical protein